MQACWSATYLGLMTEFDIHKFAIPLLLQDRESIAIDYLMGSKENQTAITAFFDGILGDPQPALSLRNYVL